MHAGFKSLCYFCVVEKIMLYIEKLLACNDHVVVPGLGAFVVQHQSAQISGDQVFPPASTIGFNPLIISSDGMLAVEISRNQKITYRQASALINTEVNKFISEATSGREMAFGRLGRFVKDQEAHLIFTPTELPAFIPANLGLSVIYTGTSSNAVSREIKFTRQTGKWIQYAAVFLVLLSLLFPVAVNENQRVSKADLSVLKTVELQEITIFPEAESLAQMTTVKKPKAEYKVVVAVYDVQQKAQQFCDQLLKEDYSTAEVLTNAHGSKVIVETFNNLISAVNYMEMLRKTDSRFADAWVMKK